MAPSNSLLSAEYTPNATALTIEPSTLPSYTISVSSLEEIAVGL
jgi:hypothetical protein